MHDDDHDDGVTEYPADETLSALPQLGEREMETTLRPSRLSEFIGQPRVREQLELVLESARRRGVPPDHVLLSGPPGLGKTSLAMIVAAELDASIRITSGPALERAGDLAAMLSNLAEGDVLFIDEIHRIARPAEEMLYLAMEDFRVDVVVGKGPGATSIPLEIAPFTLVGATTRSGALTGPLRDRFGFTGQMEFYADHELDQVIRRSATILGIDIDPDGSAEIARRSRGTPRIANRLLRRVRDYAEVREDGRVTLAVARAALEVYDVDELGWTGWTGRCCRRWCTPSAAARSGSPRSRSPSARSRRPSRRCASPTWCVRACSHARHVGGWRRRVRGNTSGCARRHARTRQGLPCSTNRVPAGQWCLAHSKEHIRTKEVRGRCVAHRMENHGTAFPAVAAHARRGDPAGDGHP